ncbi:transglycosylase SLT domain-containing protein [Streptomyces sp. SID13031]|uniref:transglycosylase SLT domain-containing protein n=1 Tax=Streptomyces sp. SID13031 TaxID=2706046 RepID=UPI0013CDD29C|nr:transglycosylase SLT domain-containing protein [Streptomyces sp. SID13031]
MWVSKGWWWLAVGAVVVAAWAARGDDSPADTAAPAQPTATPSTPKPSESEPSESKPSGPSKATPTGIPSDWYRNYDPAQFAVQVRKSAGRADVSAQLLMAILYNEDYKPHDPSLERSWQRIKEGAAFGIANMHRAAFDETKRGRFAGRQWEELPDHPELAIEAAAWHLHDLTARLGSRRGKFSKDELLALGYNAGGGNMRSFAAGAKPGAQAQSYLDNLHENWDKAAKAVRN